nr:HlyD family efflux transporter periplasmic adaptor subunit [Bacteroidota bacterium]
MDELLRVPPSMLITVSTLLVALCLVAFGVIGTTVAIPEKAEGRVTLRSNHAYVNIYPATTGCLSRVFVDDNEMVSAGTLLAIIENPIGISEYRALKTKLQRVQAYFNARDTMSLTAVNLTVIPKLGQLQSAYNNLATALQLLKTHYHSTDYAQQLVALNEKECIFRTYAANLSQQEKLMQACVKTKNKDLQRNEKLHQSGLIADTEMERLQSVMFTEKMKVEQIKGQLIENEMKLHALKMQEAELGRQRRKTTDHLYLEASASCEKLVEQLQLWEEHYLLRTPVAGRVQFAGTREERRQVSPDEVVMTILPINSMEITASMLCPAGEATNVKPGNPVLIALDGYPAINDGYVKGKVEGISEVPVDGYYTADIKLPGGMLTTLGKSIPFNRIAQGHGKIITGEEVLLKHVFNNILPKKDGKEFP